MQNLHTKQSKATLVWNSRDFFVDAWLLQAGLEVISHFEYLWLIQKIHNAELLELKKWTVPIYLTVF